MQVSVDIDKVQSTSQVRWITGGRLPTLPGSV